MNELEAVRQRNAILQGKYQAAASALGKLTVEAARLSHIERTARNAMEEFADTGDPLLALQIIARALDGAR